MKKKGNGKRRIVVAGIFLGLILGAGIFPGMPALGQPPENWKEGIMVFLVELVGFLETKLW